MRSWLFVPGHSARMIEKSMSLDVDVAMFDLEDGVVPALKSEARYLVVSALDRHAGSGSPIA